MSESYNEFENRKRDHIRFALSDSTQGLVGSGFSKIKLTHQINPHFAKGDHYKVKQELSVR